MEHELSLKQALVCFAIDIALFLIASLLCHLELASY